MQYYFINIFLPVFDCPKHGIPHYYTLTLLLFSLYIDNLQLCYDLCDEFSAYVNLMKKWIHFLTFFISFIASLAGNNNEECIRWACLTKMFWHFLDTSVEVQEVSYRINWFCKFRPNAPKLWSLGKAPEQKSFVITPGYSSSARFFQREVVTWCMAAYNVLHPFVSSATSLLHGKYLFRATE